MEEKSVTWEVSHLAKEGMVTRELASLNMEARLFTWLVFHPSRPLTSVSLVQPSKSEAKETARLVSMALPTMASVKEVRLEWFLNQPERSTGAM